MSGPTRSRQNALSGLWWQLSPCLRYNVKVVLFLELSVQKKYEIWNETITYILTSHRIFLSFIYFYKYINIHFLYFGSISWLICMGKQNVLFSILYFFFLKFVYFVYLVHLRSIERQPSECLGGNSTFDTRLGPDTDQRKSSFNQALLGRKSLKTTARV